VTERRLAAIMFTDIVGYTALMAESEEKGRRVRERHRTLLGPLSEQHHGRVVDENGDELVLCFPSALDAVSCALAAQTELSDDPDLRLRIGIHMGDVVFEDGRVYGDGVNVASRIRPLSEPGGICVSDEVQHSIQNQEDIESRSLGRHELKNVPRTVEVFAVGRPGSVRVGRRRRGQARPWSRGRSALAVLALAVVALIAWRIWEQTRGAATGPIRSIAVLPLENLSGDPEQEYFSDGMTGALIGDLAKLGTLKVISRTSVMPYKNARRPLREIAAELDVDGIIEGTVIREGDRIRIAVQLIDARSDHNLWADRYERSLRGVLALQSEIAATVAREIDLQLTPREQELLTSSYEVIPAAHDAYLRGKNHLSAFTVADTFQAIEHLERAVALDPNYAAAYAAIGEAYTYLGFGLLALPPNEAGPKAREAALRAVELQPNLATAHAVLGGVYANFDWNWGAAEKELKLAVELNPNDPWALERYAFFLSNVGRHAESLAVGRREIDVAPLDLALRGFHAHRLYFARDYTGSIEELSSILEIEPTFAYAHAIMGWAAAQLGRDEASAEASRTYWRLSGLPGWTSDAWERGYRDQGLVGARREWVAEYMRRSDTEYLPPFLAAGLCAGNGERECALELLERAYEIRDPLLVMVRSEPAFDPVRSDPRFQDLLRRIGFPES
jgi:TolB-like protein/class 3 adenylate cyclase